MRRCEGAGVRLAWEGAARRDLKVNGVGGAVEGADEGLVEGALTGSWEVSRWYVSAREGAG